MRRRSSISWARNCAVGNFLARGFGPDTILALTFTDKAAAEMQRRVRESLPELDSPPHISTFHAFCYEVLRKRHFERTLLDKVDVWIFLRRRMEKLELDFYQKLAEPGAFLHSLNDFFSRCQDELIEPVDFERYAEALEKEFQAMAPSLDAAERTLRQQEIQKKQELARVFRNSRKLIEEAGCSSLGSLIPETVRLFDREPEVLEYYRQRFRYVLVDEFQDTNYAQVELLKRLVKPPYNITAVGDDDQAIYRFRGASHGAFKMFDEAFPGHETVFLDTNYRSTKRILRVADVRDREETIATRRSRNSARARTKAAPVYLLQSPDYLSEAVWIAEEVDAAHEARHGAGRYRRTLPRARLSRSAGGAISPPEDSLRHPRPLDSFHDHPARPAGVSEHHPLRRTTTSA